MKLSYFLKKIPIFLFLSFTFLFATSAIKSKKKSLALTSVHIVDRNGFSETITNKDRLKQFEQVDFLKPQTYQKVLRLYTRDSKGYLRSIVTSYHDNGNVRQFLEILNGRAYGSYREWHENGCLRIAAFVIGGEADINKKAEQSWLFDGVSRVWDSDAHLIAEIPYCQGVLEGVSLHYHPSGTVWKRIPYQRGLAEGRMEIFKDNEELLQYTTYSQNKKNGLAVRYWSPNQIASKENYQNDKLESGEYYDQSGVLISSVENGNGQRVTFGKEGVHQLQEYKRGIVDGQVRTFNSKGRLKRSHYIRNNIKHGEEIEYYDSSSILPSKLACDESTPQPKISFTWHDAAFNGPVKTWYSNGQLESQREMVKNKKVGVATVWYRDGNLMMIEEYDQNKLTRGDYFKKGEKVPLTQVVKGKGIATIFDSEGRFVRKVNYLNGRPEE